METTRPSVERNLALDTIRAIATLMIVAYHIFFSQNYTDSHASGLGAFTRRLDVGVALFFTLSGYLLFRPFVVALFANSELPNIKTFYLKRATRIFPGYWVALITLALIDAIQIPNASVFIRKFFLIQSWRSLEVFTGIVQSWTLSVEICFYFLLPLISLFFSSLIRDKSTHTKVQIIGFGLLFLFVLSWLYRILQISDNTWFPANLDTLVLGMFIAFFVEIPESTKRVGWIKEILSKFSPLLALLSFICWFLSACIGLPVELKNGSLVIELLGHFLYAISAFIFMIPFCLQNRQSRLVRLFSLRPLAWIGKISYGIYIWHMLFLQGNFSTKHFFYTSGSGLLQPFIIILPTSIAIATLSYYIVELPIMRFMSRRLASK